MSNLKIGPRMALAFGVVLALSLLAIVLGSWRLHVGATATQQMLDESLSAERMVSEWYRLVAVGVQRTTAIVKSADPGLGAVFTSEIAASSKKAGELQKKIEPLLRADDEKKLYDQAMTFRKAYLAARDSIVAAKTDGRGDEASKLYDEKYAPAAKGYLESMEGLLEVQRKDINDAAAMVHAGNVNGRLMLLGLGLLMLGIGGWCAWSITRSITLPVRDALLSAQRIAKGDLTVRLEASRPDEIGELVKAMAEMQRTLSGTIAGIRQSTESISTASAEIAVGNQDLSQRTEQTASNLQKAASSMEQLNSTVRQTAESARTANQLAAQAATVAARGGEVVTQVVSTMDEINASSKRIADIIGVIDGIAFQTNILALNAAVEAARAGEQGRGFAVVATEVRNLAQRSAQAAREIKALIDASVSKVASGTELVADAGKTMQEIVGSVQRVTDMIGEITAAAAEQSEGIGQINSSVNDLDRMTQQNAALVEQGAAAAASLREQAQRLATAAQAFRLQSA